MKNLKKLTLCTFFTALTAVLSQIVIPIGPVPVSLATFSIFCAGALLGAKYGAISQIVYILLGLAGVPVFASFTGGAAKLIGPTGGYIIGYAAAAFIIGLISDKFKGKLLTTALSMLAGFITFSFFGTLWYMFVTVSGLKTALSVCVIPFIPGDALKIILATVLTHRLKPLIKRINY